MKYVRDYDCEEFDEDSVWDAVEEGIADDELEEVMKDYSFLTIWKHLDKEFKMEIWDKAREIVMEEHFTKVEDEEDE